MTAGFRTGAWASGRLAPAPGTSVLVGPIGRHATSSIEGSPSSRVHRKANYHEMLTRQNAASYDISKLMC